MTTFVLVHGAWHGGWCWARTARALRRLGHEVFTPTLTGLGERVHLLSPDVTLATHVDDVLNLIAAEELKDFVLCGHSYGGAVVTTVADRVPDKVRALVFLDAFIARDGTSLLEAHPPEHRAFIEASVRQGEHGPVIPPAPARFYGPMKKADAAWVDRRGEPHPFNTFTETSHITGAWRGVPRLAYIATRDFPSPAFRMLSQALAADPSIARHELPCGHDAMVSMPEEVARLLIKAARAPKRSVPGATAPGAVATPPAPSPRRRRAPAAAGD